MTTLSSRAGNVPSAHEYVNQAKVTRARAWRVTIDSHRYTALLPYTMSVPGTRKGGRHMPRDLPLANGRLLVNFDSHYTLRDLYWPHIGLRNNSEGHANRTGVWVDGAFAWLDDDEWQRDLRYEQDTLVTQVMLTHPRLQIRLQCSDAVDFDRDILVRRFRLTNDADHPREFRVFTHHDWHIGES